MAANQKTAPLAGHVESLLTAVAQDEAANRRTSEVGEQRLR